MTRSVDLFVQDVRYAYRMLAARPGWTTAAILCLAIATGANTAAFTLVNGLLLRPLPFPQPQRLTMVALRDRAGSTRPFTLEEYNRIEDDSRDIAQLLAQTYFPLSLAADDGARMAQAQLVSANYFEALGVLPLAGRLLTPASVSDNSAEVVLSHALWRSRFGADPAVVGRTVRINSRPATIVGIAPQGFVGATQLIAADLWLPASLYPSLAGSPDASNIPMFGGMARLNGTLTLDAAQTALSSIVANNWPARGGEPPPVVVMTPATGFGVPPVARATIFNLSAFIFGLMTLLMTVAAANVAALVLSRSAGRNREIGVRLALGASTGRIALQLLTESLVLAIAGNGLGAIAAVWLTGALAARITTPFSYVSYAVDVRPDLRVLAYSALATAVTTIVCGLVPLRHAARTDVVGVIKQSATSGRSRTSFRSFNSMVVAQFAVSTTLLVGASLLVRTYLNMQAVDPGFSTAGLAEVSLDVSQLQLDESRGRRLYDGVSGALRSVPEVTLVALTRDAPLTAGGAPQRVEPDASESSETRTPFEAMAMVVTADYFETLGLPMLQGRGFASVEPSQGPVVVVNEAMARRLSKDGNAVGRSFTLGGRSTTRAQVVGVVANVKYRTLTELPQPTFYEAFSQRYSSRMTALVRVRGDASALLPAIGETIRRVNRDLAVMELRTVDEHLAYVRAQRGGPATVIVIVCLLGLLLSAIGLYGVLSYSVRERAREIGIRLALGARPSAVRRLVLRQGFGVVGLGAVIGIAASLAVTQTLRGMLFGVGPHDPIAFTTVLAVLLLTACGALYFPVRWASRVDPARTLRTE